MNNNEAKIFAAQLRDDLPAIDLHGLYPSEALVKLELFIYDQFQLKQEVVKIIYGGGTGILHQKVIQYLQNHSLVGTLLEQGGSCIIFLDFKV
jgi:DNA-nicking Smr family endonuclease